MSGTAQSELCSALQACSKPLHRLYLLHSQAGQTHPHGQQVPVAAPPEPDVAQDSQQQRDQRCTCDTACMQTLSASTTCARSQLPGRALVLLCHSYL